jgi:hypothetical protein
MPGVKKSKKIEKGVDNAPARVYHIIKERENTKHSHRRANK